MDILLSGANGAMGKNIVELIKGQPEYNIVAGVDRHADSSTDFPIFDSAKNCDISFDCIIDFSHFSVVSDLIDFAVNQQKPIVICTTGLNDDTEAKILEASKKIAIFRSGNMSLGINLLIALSKKAAAILEGDFDIEIIEKHHNLKVDAPSGTAKMLADGINETLSAPKKLLYGRHGNATKRNSEEITVHAVRGGTIVGEHEVIFAGTDEVITLGHSAQSKRVFAKGAINAAAFIVKMPPGLYDMSAIFESI